MQAVVQRLLAFFILLASMGGYSIQSSSVSLVADPNQYQPKYGIEVWTPDRVLERVPEKPRLPAELSERIKGKYALFLFARAAFCGACNKQLDAYKKAYAELVNYDLEIIFTTADGVEGIAGLQKTHQLGQTALIKSGWAGLFTRLEPLGTSDQRQHLLLVGDPSLKLAREFGVINDFAGGDGLAIPSAFILDKEGKVAWVYLTKNHLTDFATPQEVLAKLVDLIS